jgi:hypothetical protein
VRSNICKRYLAREVSPKKLGIADFGPPLPLSVDRARDDEEYCIGPLHDLLGHSTMYAQRDELFVLILDWLCL